jgi:hypothetical protein
MNEAGRETEAQRLALSQALGLGTGAPWDAIRDRAAELAALPEPANRAAIRAAALREAADFVGNDDDCDCGGCDTCLPRKLAAELRRLADAASGPGGAAGETQQPETQADLLPAWEAMYEPGNVSDYLIGYANDEAPAKAAAEAWLRSQAEVTGRLEWVPQTPLDGYDQEAELIERHDDGIDTGPGITVRRRVEPAAVSQPDGEA